MIYISAEKTKVKNIDGMSDGIVTNKIKQELLTNFIHNCFLHMENKYEKIVLIG